MKDTLIRRIGDVSAQRSDKRNRSGEGSAGEGFRLGKSMVIIAAEVSFLHDPVLGA
jgi:hypothetical protein